MLTFVKLVLLFFIIRTKALMLRFVTLLDVFSTVLTNSLHSVVTRFDVFAMVLTNSDFFSAVQQVTAVQVAANACAG